VVSRLSRRHPSGGWVIERAAVMAEGSDSMAMERWVTDHGGQPEQRPLSNTSGGVHERVAEGSGGGDGLPPQRYVLPPGALD
jgi:hypothetical protein